MKPYRQGHELEKTGSHKDYSICGRGAYGGAEDAPVVDRVASGLGSILSGKTVPWSGPHIDQGRAGELSVRNNIKISR